MAFQELSPASKVWIYQSNPPFQAEDIPQINTEIQTFASQWISHNRQLRAHGQVYNQRFVILMVDESQSSASGCSIDTSVRFIEALEQRYKVSLFDRMTFAYEQEGQVQTVHKDDFAKLYEQGLIHDQTLVFDTLVSTKKDFESRWRIPLAQSWHARFVST